MTVREDAPNGNIRKKDRSSYSPLMPTARLTTVRIILKGVTAWSQSFRFIFSYASVRFHGDIRAALWYGGAVDKNGRKAPRTNDLLQPDDACHV
ncbi:hypothetical protein JCM14469_12100 [Desulfatiferula olefinivorans]